MKALILNCTLKPSPAPSNTDNLAQTVISKLESLGVRTETHRVLDYTVLPGVTSESAGEGDEWPIIHGKIIESDILILATPTWVGHPSSVAQRVLERLDGMISERQEDGRPLAYDKVAGIVVTGNEDGAHHVISELCGGLIDIGFTIPPQSWTYWNMGPGPGPDYTDTDHGHAWAKETGETAAINLVAVAHALKATPIK